jgi:hypothetical protein
MCIYFLKWYYIFSQCVCVCVCIYILGNGINVYHKEEQYLGMTVTNQNCIHEKI